eukprot:m.496508 g.496508  ORF g.496508 m.496508 type:complete len:179 (+) comp57305_c0_seq58:1426-1962(+)
MNSFTLLTASTAYILHHVSVFDLDQTARDHFVQQLQAVHASAISTITEYHSRLVMTYMLFDSDAHGYQSKRLYCEDSRVSPTLQLLNTYLCRIQRELVSCLPSAACRSVMDSLFSVVLSAFRPLYLEARPSFKRYAQFKADLFVLLEIFSVFWVRHDDDFPRSSSLRQLECSSRSLNR